MITFYIIDSVVPSVAFSCGLSEDANVRTIWITPDTTKTPPTINMAKWGYPLNQSEAIKNKKIPLPRNVSKKPNKEISNFTYILATRRNIPNKIR